MNKKDILDELVAARADLLAAINNLSPDQMLRPGAVGVWSVKDVLAHIVAWESELVTALNQVQNRRVPTMIYIDDIDEWNDKQYSLNASRPLVAILSDLEGVHKMLCRMIGDFDEQALIDNRRYSWMEGEPLSYLIEENAYLHEREHAEEIREWRQHEEL